MIGDIIQPTHLLLILVVALLVLGPRRLPEVGRGLGKGIRDFRGALAGIEEHTSGPIENKAASTPLAAEQATSAPAPANYAVTSPTPLPSENAD
jgi:sec-independent protein translocase protein TatA